MSASYPTKLTDTGVTAEDPITKILGGYTGGYKSATTRVFGVTEPGWFSILIHNKKRTKQEKTQMGVYLVCCPRV